MRERKGVGTILRAGAAMALVAALAACGGGDGDAGASQETEMSDTPSLAERISMANAAAGQLDNESDGDAVEAARGLITAAQEAIDALPGTEQDAENAKLAGSISLVEGQEARVKRDGEISGAIAEAIAAAGALTESSDKKAVDDARGLITTAQTQIDRLPSDEQAAREAELDDAIASVSEQEGRVMTETEIANAVKAANDEAGKLTDSSDAAAVAEARRLITAAEGRKADAALLATAEASVSRHENRLDRATATAAIARAEAAVNGVNNDSGDNAVTGAENEIKAAMNTVEGLPNLSDGDKALLNGRIASAQSNLDTRKSARVTAIEAKAAADAKERTATAKALHGLLTLTNDSGTVLPPEATRPTELAPGDSTSAWDNRRAAYAKAVKADNGMGTEEDAHVFVLNNEGAKVKSNTWPDGRNGANGTATALVPNGTLIAGVNAKYIRGADFATGTQRKTHKPTDTVEGYYADAAGTYTCPSGASCYSQGYGKDGAEGIQLSGGWTFQADATTPEYMVDDPAYAQFGVWLDEDVTGAARVGAWYLTSGTTPDADSGAIVGVVSASGTATYTGEAVGQAAFYDGTTSAENVGGAFTANATLNADFDANAGAGSLKGTIDDFAIGDVKPGWSVELMEQPITAGGVASGPAGSQTKWTVGETAADAGGDWSAAFYDRPANQRTPKGVAGGFLAQHGTEGRMVGAFGAER
ncbi:MAG: hypothetical protein OXD36_18145 [Rhodobacter sp.]|nr:hypothetical protein [Rhodobacter sp.]